MDINKKADALHRKLVKLYPVQEEKLYGIIPEDISETAVKVEPEIKSFKKHSKYIPEIKLSYFKGKILRRKITKSKDAEEIFREIWNKDTIELQETFYVLFLDRSNSTIGYLLLSLGGIAGTVVDTKLIFASAIQSAASSIILAHNHPSGNLKPSEADISLTKKIKEGAKLLDILLFDHLILTAEGYYGFADDGLI